MTARVGDLLAARRPDRADAARNFDAIIAAARAAFADDGADVPLADIARRAGVGVATLFRHFPTREDLAEAVYIEEVDALCQDAEALALTSSPQDALDAWIRRFVGYMTTKQVLLSALDRESGNFQACKRALYAASEPLLITAQAAGAARTDVEIDDVLRFIMGVTLAPAKDAEQRDRIIRMGIAGVHP